MTNALITYLGGPNDGQSLLIDEDAEALDEALTLQVMDDHPDLYQRLLRYHRVLRTGVEGGYMVVHGTSLEIGEDFGASLEDVARHADYLDEKYGDREDGPYPTI